VAFALPPSRRIDSADHTATVTPELVVYAEGKSGTFPSKLAGDALVITSVMTRFGRGVTVKTKAAPAVPEEPVTIPVTYVHTNLVAADWRALAGEGRASEFIGYWMLVE